MVGFHFPPEVFNLLVDTIPKLNKSKPDLLTFLQGCGVSHKFLTRFNIDTDNKYHITRETLRVLNENKSDSALGVRRRIIQRVVEFDSFDVCWDNDRVKAQAGVAEIKKLVQLKDNITKTEQYAEKERSAKINESKNKQALLTKAIQEYESIIGEFNALFIMNDPRERGLALEKVLNRLFHFYKISVRESFSIHDEVTGKCYEQIDGVIELKSTLFLIEMKWEKEKIGIDKIARFMTRLYSRNGVDGIMISSSGFSESGFDCVDKNLNQKTVGFIDLAQISSILHSKKDLKEYLESFIAGVRLNLKPNYIVDIDGISFINFANYAEQEKAGCFV